MTAWGHENEKFKKIFEMWDADLRVPHKKGISSSNIRTLTAEIVVISAPKKSSR